VLAGYLTDAAIPQNISVFSSLRFSEYPQEKVAVINRNGRGWLF